LSFSPTHRGGEGPPLVVLHGFTDTWRTWEPVLPALERRFEVFAPTLAGHAGGPPCADGGASDDAIVEALESMLGWEAPAVASTARAVAEAAESAGEVTGTGVFRREEARVPSQRCGLRDEDPWNVTVRTVFPGRRDLPFVACTPIGVQATNGTDPTPGSGPERRRDL
jgi:pimeloyl-ACP methyl ester carboxylesterase